MHGISRGVTDTFDYTVYCIQSVARPARTDRAQRKRKRVEIPRIQKISAGEINISLSLRKNRTLKKKCDGRSFIVETPDENVVSYIDAFREDRARACASHYWKKICVVASRACLAYLCE